MFRPILLLTTLGAAWAAPLPKLMPMPTKIEVNSGSLRIDSSFRIVVNGSGLDTAVERFTARLFRQAGLSAIRLPAAKPALVIECSQAPAAWPKLGEDESYQLDVTADGARLSAHTPTGVLRGLETFSQLIEPGTDGFQIPVVHIEDQPRFPWRGLMMDVSRHWMPVEVVERNLDAMAAVKLNAFHWHLADDQGFRAESKRYPKLQGLGSDGLYYTQSQIKEVVAYARDRGIRVIPEFDVPGHTTSWLVGYPELASAPGPYTIERTWGIFEPTLDPTREETYRFLDGLFGEMATLFPDPYFHIGGDEVEETQWKKSAAIQAFAREHGLEGAAGLHAYFNRRVQEILKKHGKTMIGWDEVLAPGLANNTVIQSWRGPKSLAEAARKGYRGILSSGYYLDHLLPARTYYAVDPMADEAGSLDADQSARILGGEACMWAEYVSSETVDSRIWPRMAAIAERFWSPREVRDVDSMYSRMEAVSRVLEWTGVRHRANYEPMLDRIAGGQPLRVLADASEALGIEVRRDARKYTSLIDLNRFVDAVRPESEFVRNLRPSDMRATFKLWADNDGRLDKTAMTAELAALSKNLSAVGAIGLQALEYIDNGKPVPEKWVAEQKPTLDEMEKPTAEVKLAAVRPVRALLDEASRKTASAQLTGDGVKLAMDGRCADAAPLLDEAMRDAALGVDAKRTVSIAGVRCSMLLSRQSDAMSYLAWLQEAYPKDPDVMFLSVHVFSDLSHRNEQSLMHSAPDSPLVIQLNAENFEKQGDFPKAIAEYRILLQRTADKPGIHYRIGGLLMSLTQTPTSAEEARKEFEAELRLDPRSAGAEYYLGELARRSDALPKAADHFKRATELNPGFAEAYYGWGKALLDSGKAADATAPLETAVKLAPENPTVHFALASAYQRTGRKEEAAREFALQRSTADKLNQREKTLHKTVSGAEAK